MCLLNSDIFFLRYPSFNTRTLSLSQFSYGHLYLFLQNYFPKVTTNVISFTTSQRKHKMKTTCHSQICHKGLIIDTFLIVYARFKILKAANDNIKSALSYGYGYIFKINSCNQITNIKYTLIST